MHPARGGVGLSHRRARLEFSSGIYFPTIGHRGDNDSNLNSLSSAACDSPDLELPGATVSWHNSCSPAAAAAVEAGLTELGEVFYSVPKGIAGSAALTVGKDFRTIVSAGTAALSWKRHRLR